jgi:NitT/TauT family transport system substrate-binding protein
LTGAEPPLRVFAGCPGGGPCVSIRDRQFATEGFVDGSDGSRARGCGGARDGGFGRCGANGGAPPLSPPVAVKVGVLDSLGEAPIFIAVKRGYFEAEGLKVELVSFADTATMVAPLSAGQVDVGVGAPTAGFFNAVARGIPLKLVGDKGRNSAGHGFNALVIRKDLVESGKVKTLADIKGLKIGPPSRLSPVEIELDVGLRKVGLSLEDVVIEQVAFPEMIAAMGSKALDGAMMIEPLIALSVANGVAVRFMGVDEMYPDYQVAGVLYGASFPKESAEAAKRWMVAYVRGIRDFHEALKERGAKWEEVVDQLVANTRVKNRQVYERVAMPGFDADGYLNLETISASIDWFEKRGVVKTKPALESFVDYQYLDYAHARLGRRGPARTVK